MWVSFIPLLSIVAVIIAVVCLVKHFMGKK